MKTPISLAPLVLVVAVNPCYGQNFNSSAFFAPEIRAQHTNTSAILAAVTLDNSVISNQLSSGNVTWNLGAGGYAGINALGVEIFDLELRQGVHLSAFTQTTGNSLVFGRSMELEGLVGGLSSLLNQVTSAGVFSTWSATAEVGGLNILAGQLYQVTFDVTSGPNLPVTLLSNSSFGISSDGVTTFGGNAQGLIDLLGVVNVGETQSSGSASIYFMSSTNRSELDFDFNAQSLVRLGLLGGEDGNENVLTFSNIQVQAVPEPSAYALSALAAGGLVLRRRRGK